MELTAALLAGLAEEADSALSGRELRTVVDAPGGGHLFLFGEPGGDRIVARLLVVSEPKRARAHLVPSRPPPLAPPPESAFVRDALPILRGLRLRRVAAAHADRLVHIEFEARDAPAGALPTAVVAELFGAAPNVLLVDPTGVIRALKHSRAGKRPAGVGARWIAPPALTAGTPETEAGPPLGAGDAAPQGDFARAAPLSAAVDARFHPRDLAAEREARIARVRERLGAEAKRLRTACRHLQEDVDRGAEAARARELGDCLAARFRDLAAGLASIEVEDLYRGGTVAISLDPALAPEANLQRWYRTAHRLERGAAIAGERLAAATRRLADVDAAHAALCGAADETALEAALAAAARLLPGAARPAAARREKAAPAPRESPGVRSFRLPSGLEVLVGRTNRDNDHLTTRIARGNDVWLHVQGAAGSHVVIRLPSGKTASLDDLLDAGALAIHFSKRRGLDRCEVTWTLKKHVRKSRGMAPGAVLVERHKSLLLGDAAARARRLLQSAPDDGSPPAPA